MPVVIWLKIAFVLDLGAPGPLGSGATLLLNTLVGPLSEKVILNSSTLMESLASHELWTWNKSPDTFQSIFQHTIASSFFRPFRHALILVLNSQKELSIDSMTEKC